MRTLSFLSLGLLLAAGCADTADDYEVNKPVISEPADDMPATDTETDLDMDADLDDADATDTTDAPATTVAPESTDVDSATDGAFEDDTTTDETQPVVP